MNPSPNFKLDIGSVEKDEDRCDFLSACSSLDLRSIRHLVDIKGIDVKTAVDPLGQNCVHFVVCSAKHELQRQIQLIGYLTSVGADVNAARTSDGWTPLFLACIFGEHQLVMSLLHNGARANIEDKEGKTPEDWAIKYRMEEVRDLLIHSRSKVPHSRFSCVQQGPALESPSLPKESSAPTSPPSSSSSSEATPPPSVNTRPISEVKEASEACLLTAQ